MLRWLIGMNRLILLGLTVGIMSSVFLVQLMTFFIKGPGVDIISYIMDCAGFGSFAISLLMVVFASAVFTAFTSIGSKPQRSTFLMMPASNGEKFLALMVYVTVVCGLCAIVGYVLGDCLRMAWFWFWGHISADPEAMACKVYNYNAVDHTYYWWSSTVGLMFGKMTPHLITVWGNWMCWDWFQWASLIVGMLIAVWTHSFFTLGGTLLRKYSFVIPGLLWVSIGLLFMGSLHHFNLSVFGNITLPDGTTYTATVDTMAYVLMVVLPLFIALNYWLAYRIFKDFQVITNKWVNYDILKR